MEGVTPAMPLPPLPQHPAVAPLSFLLGVWEGEGEGSFPAIAPFRYRPMLVFKSGPSEPVVEYTQSARKVASSELMHLESGYWMLMPDGSLKVAIATSKGTAELQKGSYDAEKKTVTLRSELLVNASEMKQIIRTFEVVDDKLSYVVQMETTTTGLQPYLKAVLKKIGTLQVAPF